jgi:transaldolase/glucose-6-phosphate isomerase
VPPFFDPGTFFLYRLQVSPSLKDKFEKFDTELRFPQDDFMLNSLNFVLPDHIQRDVDTEAAEWDHNGKVARLWAKDATLWTGEDEGQWLDWLDVIELESARIQIYRDFRSDIENERFSNILLMGMGGSSLCPEVLAKTFKRPNFHILDSTVPAQVRSVEGRLDLSKTLFIVASKSGSTLEPNCFKQYFYDQLSKEVGRENAGRQFVAITDPGSKMERVAKEDGFRHIFYGEPGIGGRFSALSAFGMTAAAAMGLDVSDLLASANVMAEACRRESVMENPGVLLGIILGVCHGHRRDKLTIVTSHEISGLGAWLEQLIAESTGKDGVAIVPVDQEPQLSATNYSDDRVFVFLGVGEESSNWGFYEEVARSGHPVVKIQLDGIEGLVQEFFRSEIATAVAGSVMKINPFNQPDVESAKIEARKITEEYEETGTLPTESPFLADGQFELYAAAEYATTLRGSLDAPSIKEVLRTHLDQIGPQDYFATLAYIEMTDEAVAHLATLRQHILESTHAATCLGFGPRFLHSTGQAYKGGPNSGVFLQITSDDPVDLPIPGQKYSFGVVKTAQARGDFEVLLNRGRRALRVHISGDLFVGIGELIALIQ